MEQTKSPLTIWFFANSLFGQANPGVAAPALKRQIGVSYSTAWLLRQTIFGTLARQDSTHQLGGLVQLDDALRPWHLTNAPGALLPVNVLSGALVCLATLHMLSRQYLLDLRQASALILKRP